MKQIVKTRLLATIIATAVGVLSSGCLQREVEHKVTPTEGKLDVSVDWGEGYQPAELRMLIYNENGTLYGERTSSENQMQWTLPEGAYRLIVHNTDGQNVRYLEMSKHAEAFIYVTSSTGQMVNTPQNIYSVAAHDNAATIDIVAGAEHQIRVVPQRATRGVHFTFKIVGLPVIASLQGTLSGVSPGMMIASGTYFDVPSTQPFLGTPMPSPASRAATTRQTEPIWYQSDMEFFNLVDNKGNRVGINILSVEITDDKQVQYNVTSDITSSVQQIIIDNGGELPVEVPLDVEIEVAEDKTIEISVSVARWNSAGNGTGNVID